MSSLVRCVLPARFLRLSFSLLAFAIGALLLPSLGHASCSTSGNVTTCTGSSITLNSTLNASAGSTIAVSGIPGTVSAISVTFTNLNFGGGGANATAFALVPPSGTAFDLLSGPCNVSNSTFTLADSGINGLDAFHTMVPLIGGGATCPAAFSGVYYPSDWFPAQDTFNSPGPGTAYNSGGTGCSGLTLTCGSFNFATAFGLPASAGSMNGNWTLYIASQVAPAATGSLGSWSIAFTTISATSTTTSLSASPNGASSIVYTNKNVHGDSTTGTNVTLTATVSPNPGGGTVTFYDSTGTNPGQGTVLASGIAVNGSGQAQSTVTLASEGNRSISAVYSGNSSFATSTSTKTNVLTTNHPYKPSANSYCNGPITINDNFTNSVNDGAATPYASLLVLDKNDPNIGTIAGTIQDVSVSLNNINLQNGTVLQDLGFLLQAPGSNTTLIGSSGNAYEFLGWGGNPYTSGSLTISDSGSAQVPFDAAPSCSTCLPSDNYVDNGSTNIDGFPSPAPTPTGKAAPTGSDTLLTQFGGQGANYTWSLYVADRITEVAPLGSVGEWCLNFTMQANAHPTTTTVTSSANPASFTAVNNTGKATITLTATVTSDQTVNAGSVTFVDGSTSLGSATVVNGVATLSNAQLNEGTHEITATYGGTNTGTEFGVSTYKYVERVNANTVPTSGSGAGPYVYCNPGAITAPGLGADAGAAYPYPSNIFVTNLPGTVKGTSVTYNAFNTKDQAALMSLLVGPSTNSNQWNNNFDFFSLTGSAWNGIGGLPTFTPTFIDGGTAIGSTTLSTTGNYAPESFENLTFPQCSSNAPDCGTRNVGPPLGTSSTFTPTNKATAAGASIFGNANAAGVFGGTTASTYNANGTWSLYLDDGGPLGGGEPTNLTQGWCVNFTINQPVVAPSTSHSGNGIGGDFIQGEQGGQITVDVANDGPGSTGDPTGNSPMTVTDTFTNSDLTFNSSVANGTDWTCTATGTPQTVTCKNHDTIAAGSNYPTLTIGVNVANNAASSYTNKVSAAGAGAASVTSGNDVITIDQAPVLAVAVSHSGNFTQGTNGEWDVTVSNTATTGRTLGTTTTVVTLPANYTLVSSTATGATWGCGGASNVITCTTTSNINGGANSKIALTVNVPDTSPTSVSTTAIAYGGGDLNHTNAGNAATSNVDTATVIQVPATVTINSGDSQSTTILTAFASPLVATVKDAAGVTIPNYSPVSFAAATGTNGQGGTFSNSSTIISTTSGTGAAAGQVSETITANNKVGVFTVTVTAGTAQATFNSLTNLHGAPAGITVVSGTPQTTADTTPFAAPLVANVVDIGGNAVPGATVTFTAPSTGASATFAGGVNTAVTDATGNATSAALTANGTLGTYSVTASTSGLTAVSFSLTNALGPYAQLAVTVPPPVYATVATQFTVVAEDAGGNLVSTATPTLHFTSTDSAANMPADATLSGGTGTFTATLNTVGTWEISANDATNSITGTASNINVLAIPILVVTTAADDSASPLASNCTQQAAAGTGTDSSCSLRDALLEAAVLEAANISFDTAKLGSSISINAGSTLTVPANTNIQGPAAGVTVNGGGNSSDYPVFTVGTGVRASIANFVISHGNTSGNGGGIQNMGTLTVTGTTVSGNAAHVGGGIANLNPGTLTLTNSTVSGNAASANGGGIYSEGTLTVTNSTIAQNTAVTHGGGIDSSATAQVYDSTISGNTANTGGGIATASGTFKVANAIVAGNSAPNSADGNGTFTSGGHNVIGDGTGASGISNGSNGDQVGTTAVPVNAALTSLGNYGGTTQTMLPQPGSAAICAGAIASMPTGLATDQRGFPNFNITYPNYSAGNQCVDSGAVQTNYSLNFSGEPPSQVNAGAAFSAAVTLLESGSVFTAGGATIPLTLTGSGTLSNNSASTSAGVATYSNLIVDTAGTGDVLNATLTLNSLVSPVATAQPASSNSFDVIANQVTVQTSPSGLVFSVDGTTYTSPQTFNWIAGSHHTLSTLAQQSGNATVYQFTGWSDGTSVVSDDITVSAGSSTYTASFSSGPAPINYLNFNLGGCLQLNGSAKLSGGTLELTDGAIHEAGSAFCNTTQNVQSFTSDFTFQLTNATADGFMFVIQGQGPNALGWIGSGLGFQHITPSVGVKFDLYNNNGEGMDSTGLFVNGAIPTNTGSVDLSSTAINFHSGDTFAAHAAYDGTTLKITLLDTVTGATATQSYPIDIPTTIGSPTGYVGFTGGTGGLPATQKILTWSYAPGESQILPASPTFSLPGGIYTSPQIVALSTTTPGATIYYTTDGSLPTFSGGSPTGTTTPYSGNITVVSSEDIHAVAVVTQVSSLVSTAQYDIEQFGFGGGFNVPSACLQLNGSAQVSGSALELTDGSSNEAGSAFCGAKLNVQSFTSDFTFQLTNPRADGFMFVVQGQAPTALGVIGAGLGFQNISRSVGVKFDLFSNAGEGNDSTGIYLNGAVPTNSGSTDLSSTGINFHSGDTFAAHAAYDGTTLTMTIMDTVTGATATQSYPIDIPSIVGGNSAYVGFTAGTGGLTATQKILTWTYASGAPTVLPSSPTFSVPGGTYVSTQSVALSTTTPGATIYYTTDGSAPSVTNGTPNGTTTAYAGAITVSASETIQAIAVLNNVSSLVSSAQYVIESMNYSGGFSDGGCLQLNGSAQISGSALELTDGSTNQAGSAFCNARLNAQSFTTDFTFQLTNPNADGFMFVIQGQGATALGAGAGGLGFQRITPSVGVKFDLFNNGGEGNDSTGLFLNGAYPTSSGSVDLSSTGINLHSGDTFAVHATYDGTTLTVKITDTVTNATVTQNYPIDIPTTIGGNTAYFGFTGGTGGATATQKILTWTQTP